jgi:hypothetical protein
MVIGQGRGAAAGALFMALLLSSPAGAKSAVAAGIPDSVAADGVALGEGHNYSTRDEAESKALDECRSNKDSAERVHALCKIIAHFDDRCFTSSLDPAAGTPGWGWAVADTKSGAEDQALAMCRASAGAARAPYCVVSQSVCDGAAAQNSK